MLPNCQYEWNGIEYSISVKAQRIEVRIESRKTGKPKQKIHPD